jgi:diadenosine tetraphosphate (Ap4A) HIT family hydrolase
MTDPVPAAPGLAHLWAGWRSAGFARRSAEDTAADPSGMKAPAEPGCVFCRIAQSPLPAVERLVVAQQDGLMVVMNLYPYTSGHVMVIPERHTDVIAGLSDPESDALWAMIRRADIAVRKTFHPDGTNIGINQGIGAGASIPDHLHVHIVPRWANDTNFMTTVADTRVMIETIHRSYERLAGNW